MTASKSTKKKSSGGSNGASNFNNLKTPKRDEKKKALSSAEEVQVELAKLATPVKDGSVKKVPVVDADIDEHPLKISNFLVVEYRDGSHRLAKIIEKMTKTVDKKLGYQYYVHYTDFNRRMDEWIGSERIFLLPSAANILGAENAAAHAHGRTDDKKAPAGEIEDYHNSVFLLFFRALNSTFHILSINPHGIITSLPYTKVHYFYY